MSGSRLLQGFSSASLRSESSRSKLCGIAGLEKKDGFYGYSCLYDEQARSVLIPRFAGFECSEPTQFGDELFRMNGLGEKFKGVAVVLRFAHKLAGRGLSGEQKDPSAGKFQADFHSQLDSRHPRHQHVGQHNVRLEL